MDTSVIYGLMKTCKELQAGQIWQEEIMAKGHVEAT
jgi:hypothetical protein